MNRRRHLIAVAIAIAVAGVIGWACAPATSSSPSVTTPSSAVAPSAPIPSAPAVHLLATIAIDGNPNGMIEAFGSVWVASRGTNTVHRIDVMTNKVTAAIGVGAEPSYLVADSTAVWVAEFGAQSLARIDPGTNSVEQIALPGDLGGGPVAGAGAIWQDTAAGVVAVSVRSHKVLGSIKPGGPSGVAFAGGLIWTAQPAGTGIGRYDPATLAQKDVVATSVDASGTIAAEGGLLWAANGTTGASVDVKTGKVLATYALPDGVDGGMGVLSGGRIWLTRLFPLAFTDVDPTIGRADPMQALPSKTTTSLYFVDRGPHDLWISDWDNNVVYRVDPHP